MVILLSLLFIGLNSVLLYNGSYLGLILPAVLLVVYWAVFSYDKVWFLVLAFTPVSLPLQSIVGDIGFDLHMPTEPLLAGLLLIFVLRSLQGKGISVKLAKHPVSWAIYAYVLWLLVTTLSSSMPLVSFKTLLTRIWYIAPFFFMAAELFKKPENIRKYYWFYLIPFVITIVYATTMLSFQGFSNHQAANRVMKPLFNDHTLYGAVLAMYIPPIVALFFYEKKVVWRALTIILAVVYGIGLTLSYSRAAWISLVAAGVFYALLRLKISFKAFMGMAAGALLVFLLFSTSFIMKLEKNKQDSSGDFGEHIQSMSNIRSDASNLERINRWVCAVRMFNEKPVLGWGPGTYQFKYAPYQFSYNQTIISTNFGDWGTAHSEYLGPLAESGFMGTITLFVLILVVLYKGMNVYYRLHGDRMQYLVAGALLGLVTYWVHGVLNNFLDTDKASVPFWGFTAIIVAVDVFYERVRSS